MFNRIVIFGASGDLTARLLMPAVAQLKESNVLPADLAILGSAVSEWTAKEFRDHIAQALEEHAAQVSSVTRKAVVDMLDYRPADVTDPADVKAVIGDDHDPTLVYLALPSGLLEAVVPALSGAGLGGDDAVAIEKPFGTDLASARRLNKILRTGLPESTIFRIDHFLSDELVRRILSLRFLNRIFEPILNTFHVERVDINWLESLALEGRAAYYDRAGAMKDMLQNHLMEALSLIVMEQPARIDSDSFRGNRVEALRCIPTPTLEQIQAGTIRARYTVGSVGSRQVPSYVDEPGVDPARGTETYADIDLAVQNARWAGVPFTLRSGKAMPADSAEIAIHFRPLPPYLFDLQADIEPNVLRIGLMQPYVRLGTTVNGPDQTALYQQLELLSPAPRRTPYANLILEMLRNRPLLFIRGDEAEEAWRIIDPIAQAWAADKVPMQTYPAGSEPPATLAGT
jgi:glucose-6-phosphate 1-dehydrogenase